MPSYYCSASGCGFKVQYEAVKPTHCPKCKHAYASAFVAAIKVTRATMVPVNQFAPIQPLPNDDLEDTTPRNPLRNRPASTTVAKPRFRHGQELPPIMGTLPPVGVLTAAAGPGTDDDDDDDDEYVDPRMRRRLARELAATIDPDTIHVDDEDEHPTTFATIWNDPKAAAAREKGVAPKAKRSRKR